MLFLSEPPWQWKGSEFRSWLVGKRAVVSAELTLLFQSQHPILAQKSGSDPAAHVGLSCNGVEINRVERVYGIPVNSNSCCLCCLTMFRWHLVTAHCVQASLASKGVGQCRD